MPRRLSTAQRSAQLRREAKAERARDIKRLQKAGLIGKRFTQKPVTILRKYRDVLQRKATVVTVPKGFKTSSLKTNFRVRGMNVVIPHIKGERVRLEKRTGRITSTRKVAGERVKKILHFGGKLPTAGKGKKLMYSMPFSGGQLVRFESLDALSEFMAGYNTYKNWRDYLEIDEIDADEEVSDDE